MAKSSFLPARRGDAIQQVQPCLKLMERGDSRHLLFYFLHSPCLALACVVILVQELLLSMSTFV
jgi:hypothetical protein